MRCVQVSAVYIEYFNLMNCININGIRKCKNIELQHTLCRQYVKTAFENNLLKYQMLLALQKVNNLI